MKKIIYKGRIFTLNSRQELLPNGKISSLDIIEHPGAALIIPFFSEDKIIILRQYRAAAGGYIYELPAGTLEKKEKPRSCAAREIREETGYAARKLIRLGIIMPLPGYSTEKIFIYKAEDLVKKEQAFDPDEIIETSIMTRKQIKDLFFKKKLIDAKTICALAMCGWL